MSDYYVYRKMREMSQTITSELGLLKLFYFISPASLLMFSSKENQAKVQTFCIQFLQKHYEIKDFYYMSKQTIFEKVGTIVFSNPLNFKIDECENIDLNRQKEIIEFTRSLYPEIKTTKDFYDVFESFYESKKTEISSYWRKCLINQTIIYDSLKKKYHELRERFYTEEDCENDEFEYNMDCFHQEKCSAKRVKKGLEQIIEFYDETQFGLFVLQLESIFQDCTYFSSCSALKSQLRILIGEKQQYDAMITTINSAMMKICEKDDAFFILTQKKAKLIHDLKVSYSDELIKLISDINTEISMNDTDRDRLIKEFDMLPIKSVPQVELLIESIMTKYHEIETHLMKIPEKYLSLF